MNIVINCPHCRQKLEVGEEWTGKSCQCPSCNQVFEILPPDNPRNELRPAEGVPLQPAVIAKTTMKTDCPNCGQSVEYEANDMTRQVQCAQCGNSFFIQGGAASVNQPAVYSAPEENNAAAQPKERWLKMKNEMKNEELLALIGMICGLASIPCCICFPIGIAGIVCSVLGLRKLPADSKYKQMAIVGMISGGIGLLVFIGLFFLQFVLPAVMLLWPHGL